MTAVALDRFSRAFGDGRGTGETDRGRRPEPLVAPVLTGASGLALSCRRVTLDTLT